MDNALKDKWVAALRSGEYKQGCRVLRNSVNGCCCLGVLCEVAGADVANWQTSYGGKVTDDWLNDQFGIPIKRHLATMNDGGGGPQYSFDQIADYIERNL